MRSRRGVQILGIGKCVIEFGCYGSEFGIVENSEVLWIRKLLLICWFIGFGFNPKNSLFGALLIKE